MPFHDPDVQNWIREEFLYYMDDPVIYNLECLELGDLDVEVLESSENTVAEVKRYGDRSRLVPSQTRLVAPKIKQK